MGFDKELNAYLATSAACGVVRTDALRNRVVD